MAQVQLRGFAELDRELSKLPVKIQQKVLKKTVREGAKVVQKAARKNAPVSSNRLPGMKYEYPSGHLRKNIKVRAMTKRDLSQYGNAKDMVGVKVTLGKGAWYGSMVEFGHKLSRNKKQFGHVPPNPFMRRAFDSNKQQVLAKMKTTFLTELGKYKKG